MLKLRCPECGEMLGYVEHLYRKYVAKIMALSLSPEEQADKKAELSQLLVRDLCCRGHLISYTPIIDIAS